MSYKNYLPSKEFIKRISSLVLLIVGFLVIYLGGEKLFSYLYSKTASNKEATPQIVVKDLVVLDRDNDDLKDWEEPLWQMDPENPDTNSNGVLDGAEVSAKRDQIAQKNIARGDDPDSILDGSENETEAFMRELLITMTSVGQAGNITQEGADAIASPAVEQIKALQLSKLYTLAEIKTGTKTTATRLEAYNYALKMDNLLKKYPLTKDVSLLIVKKAFDTKDATYLSKLTPIQENYKNLINGMLAISVPKPFAENHLRIINAILAMNDGSKALQKVYDNPVKALAALMQYGKYVDELKDSLNAYLAALTPYQNGTLGK